jgi:hypothetical protein
MRLSPSWRRRRRTRWRTQKTRWQYSTQHVKGSCGLYTSLGFEHALGLGGAKLLGFVRSPGQITVAAPSGTAQPARQGYAPAPVLSPQLGQARLPVTSAFAERWAKLPHGVFRSRWGRKKSPASCGAEKRGLSND